MSRCWWPAPSIPRDFGRFWHLRRRQGGQIRLVCILAAPGRSRPQRRAADHSDACRGLIKSAADYLPEARWQRCMVHFYRNVFSHVPATKVRDVSHMLKAIHAQESRAAGPEGQSDHRGSSGQQDEQGGRPRRAERPRDADLLAAGHANGSRRLINVRKTLDTTEPWSRHRPRQVQCLRRARRGVDRESSRTGGCGQAAARGAQGHRAAGRRSRS